MPVSFEVEAELVQLRAEIGTWSASVLTCANCLVFLWMSPKIHRVHVPGKRALNIPVHSDGVSPIAYLCDECMKAGKPPLFIIHKEKHFRQRVVHINIEDLPDA